jgi:hypothetical protein
MVAYQAFIGAREYMATAHIIPHRRQPTQEIPPAENGGDVREGRGGFLLRGRV